MVQVTYPGVYVVEVPSGVHTIAGVSTSVAAFVDRFARGPDNKAVQIFGLGDFNREFGGLAAYSPASYAIQQFFLNGGAEAWVVRVGNGSTTSQITLKGGKGGTTDILHVSAGRQVGGVSVENPGSWGNWLRVDVDYDTATLPNANIDPGKIEVQDELFNLTVSQVEIRNGRTLVVQRENFPNLTMRSGVPNNAIAIVNEESRLVQLDSPGANPFDVSFRPGATGTQGVDPVALAAAPEVTAAEAAAQASATAASKAAKTKGDSALAATSAAAEAAAATAAAAAAAADPNDTDLAQAATAAAAAAILATDDADDAADAASDDATAAAAAHATALAANATAAAALAAPATIPASGEIDISIDGVHVGTAVLDFAGPAPASLAGVRPFLEAAIRKADPDDPRLAGATVQFANGSFRVLLGRGGLGFDPAEVVSFGDTDGTATLLGLVSTAAVASAQQFALTGGSDGSDLSDAEFRGNLASKRGMYALEDVSLFNILCLPAAADLLDTEMRNTYAAAAGYCEDRRAFLLIDIPKKIDTLADMQGWLNDNDTLRHKNAAVYFPRVRISDPLNQGRLKSVAASGTLAGVYARTDGTRGVWKAPAGIEAQLRGVQELAVALTDRENGALNPLAANVLRSFPVYGIVAWGARTLEGADQRASEWKYVPIRRLALFLEESLFRGTKWVVFEPNDEPLWAQIRMNLNAFMMGLFRQGAFQGSSPKDAFFVKCDAQTTTQNDRNLGIVNIEVGFAPLKPAEFVVLRIQQIAGDLG